MNQAISSAKTSRNFVPKIVNQMLDWDVFESGQVILDYGGGRYELAKDAVNRTFGVNYLIYDIYNRTQTHNMSVLRQLNLAGGADVVILSNVLNVIKEGEVRKCILENCRDFVKDGGQIFISIYNAPRSDKYSCDEWSVGQPTRDGWQNCQPLSFYVSECEQLFNKVEVKKGFIIISEEQHEDNVSRQNW